MNTTTKKQKTVKKINVDLDDFKRFDIFEDDSDSPVERKRPGSKLNKM